MKPKKQSELMTLEFRSRLERIAPNIEYYALPVPAKITQALGTRGPVPVHAQVNDSEPFLISLYPVGGGRHALRVKAEIRKQTKIKEGDRVRVRIAVRDRNAETSIPQDLAKSLRSEGVHEHFKALPVGQRSYLLRLIGEAIKTQTRERRIREAVATAKRKKNRS